MSNYFASLINRHILTECPLCVATQTSRLMSMHSILAKPDNVTSFSKIFLRANTPSSLFFCIPQEALNACENSTRISRCHGLFFFKKHHQLQGVSLRLTLYFVQEKGCFSIVFSSPGNHEPACRTECVFHYPPSPAHSCGEFQQCGAHHSG